MKEKVKLDIVTEIKKNIRITDLVKRLGFEVIQEKTVCPFHDDNNPSLQIYDDDPTPQYHCFACDAHGDVIKFIQEYKNLTFKETLRWFDTEFNLNLYKNREKDSSRKWQNPIQFAYDIFVKKANFPKLEQWSKEKRKMNIENIQQADVIYLEKNTLKKDINGFSDFEWGLLEDAGIVKYYRPKDDDRESQYVNRPSLKSEIFYYECIIFPIKNIDGTIVGLAARENENNKNFKGPKYRYTKGFKKSEILYRIDSVMNNLQDYKKHFRKDKDTLHKPFEIYLVEGFMDALRLESLGLNALAVLGSDLTGTPSKKNGQLNIIKTMSKYLEDIPLLINIFFDNDDAGKKGAKRALIKLSELAKREDLLFSINVMISDSSKIEKDPDALFIKNDATNIQSWKRNPKDFYIAEIINCHIDDVNLEIDKLSELQKSQLIRKLSTSLISQTIPDTESILPGFLQGIENEVVFAERTLNYDPKFLSDIQKAISQCKSTYTGEDFPIDFKSWDRLLRAGNLLIEEFKDILNSKQQTEPYLGMLIPRKLKEDITDPRLITLPSIEDLVMQEYVLNKLIGFTLKNATSDIPVVFYDENMEQLFTHGNSKTTVLKEKTVSFAYQVNKSSFLEGGGLKSTLFRNFADCWEDFNNYIFGKIRNFPESIEHLYPARLDIHRFYDSITQHSLITVLKPSLIDAFKKGLELPGLDASTPEESADRTIQWILSVSFGYKYYGPDGNLFDWPYKDRGIPQGPNLSAWLGNIVLFPVDKVMNDAVDKINKNYLQNNTVKDGKRFVVAIYARYVDDVVIVAPDYTIALELQQKFSNEIAKIDLTLSSKTDPMEPETPQKIKDWLMENRGFGRNPYDDFVVEPFSEIMINSNWQDVIDRKDALSLLHNNIFITDLKTDEMKAVINLITEKSSKLRYRDYRYIAQRLWRIVWIDSKEKTSEKVTKELISLFNKNTPIKPCADKFNDSVEQISDFNKTVTHIWPLMVLLEGLQISLRSRFDLSLNFSDEERKELNSFRIGLAQLIMNADLVGFLIKQYFKKKGDNCSTLKKHFKFILELRELSIKQQAIEILNVSGKGISLTDNSYERRKNALRFYYSNLSYTTYEGLLPTPSDDDNTYDKIMMFHAVISTLEQSNNSTKDYAKVFNFDFRTDSYLFQNLSLLCNNSNDYEHLDIKDDVAFEALQVFASCITKIDRQFELLKQRQALLKCISGSLDNLYFLPHPENIPAVFIKAVKLDDEKQITDFYIFSKEKNESLLEQISVEDYVDKWKDKEKPLEIKIVCQSAKSNKCFIMPISRTKDIDNSIDKIKFVLNSYQSIIKIKNLENYLITPFNIIEENENYEVFSAFRESNVQDIGFGANLYKDLEAHEVAHNNSKYWRAGIAIAGLLDLSKYLSKDSKNHLQKISETNFGVDDKIIELFLKNFIYIITGSKWWSKPIPSSNDYTPQIIRKWLDLAELFVKSESEEERFSIWFLSHAENVITKVYSKYKENIKMGGFFTFFLNQIGGDLFFNHDWLISRFVEISKKVKTENDNLPRSIISLNKIIGVLKEVNAGGENTTHLLSVFKIKAITEIFKTYSLCFLKKNNETFFEGKNSSLEGLYNSSNSILAIWCDDNELFFDELNSRLKVVPYNDSFIGSITPLGWFVIFLNFVKNNYGYEFSKVFQDESILKCLNYSMDFDEKNWPWWKIDMSPIVDIAYNKTFELIKKIDLTVKHIQGKRIYIAKKNELIEFDSSDGEFLIKPWQITVNRFFKEKINEYEKKEDVDGKTKYIWTEIWHKKELLFVSILGSASGSLLNYQINKKDKIVEESKKRLNEEKLPLNPSSKSREEPKDKEKPKIISKTVDSFDDFSELQNNLWKKRVQRLGRHIRVAFFQFDVDESYSHPLKDICTQISENENFIKNPQTYTKKEGVDDFGKLTKIKSCAEYRRRAMIKKVVETCKILKVDLLLLPEYSIRPETVKFIQNELIKIKSSLVVWCGTYRLPYWEKTFFESELPFQSILHVVSSEESVVRKRGKKYPAVGLSESFNPQEGKINPLFKLDTHAPGNYISELICAENFCITSPLNRNGIVQSWNELRKIFGKTKESEETVNNVLEKDIQILADGMGLANKPSSEGLKWLKKFTPRRSILFVPAMTSRSVDYHILGQSNYLSSGICTVLCNTTKDSHGDGGSCFIGHGCWTNRFNSDNYIDDRLGPYNGIYPGIYRNDQKNNGALGKKDQALVIADVDPEYQNEGKPRQQMLIPPLKLVAHIPIIEIEKNKPDEKKLFEEKRSCSCGRVNLSFKDVEFVVQDIIKTLNNLNAEKKDHKQKEKLLEIADDMKKICDKDSWLKEKILAYKENAMAFISNSPPAFLYDIVFVKTKEDNTDNLPEIEVPPFKIAFDEVKKESE